MERISELLVLIDREIAAQGMPARDVVPAPADSGEMKRLQSLFSSPLPEDLHGFFELQDGEDAQANSCIFGTRNFRLFRVSAAIDDLLSTRAHVASMPGLLSGKMWKADLSIIRAGWHETWLPLTDVIRGLHVEVSDRPQAGQIFHRSDANCELTFVASSLMELLEMQLVNLRRGFRNLNWRDRN